MRRTYDRSEFDFFATLTAINRQHAANLGVSNAREACLPEPESCSMGAAIIVAALRCSTDMRMPQLEGENDD